MAARKYTKGKPLGQGSFGCVFLGTESASRETVVLKQVDLTGLKGKDLKMALAEVDMIQKLKHDSIIAYRDSFVDQKTVSMLTIVMEHAAGGDLGSMITRRSKAGLKFSEPEVLKILAQSADALAYCHSQHVLHRDLKPENIFLTSKELSRAYVKIGDFGISRELASTHAMAHTKLGTPLYMSPELASGKPYDSAADVWALGCVMYAVMTLTQPWMDRVGPKGGMMALMRLINTSSLDLSVLRGEYSAGLCELIGSLLAKPASARPTCAQILASPLVTAALGHAALGAANGPSSLSSSPPKTPPALNHRAASPSGVIPAPARVKPVTPPQRAVVAPPRTPASRPASAATAATAAAAAAHAAHAAHAARGAAAAARAAADQSPDSAEARHAAAAAVQRSFRSFRSSHRAAAASGAANGAPLAPPNLRQPPPLPARLPLRALPPTTAAGKLVPLGLQAGAPAGALAGMPAGLQPAHGPSVFARAREGHAVDAMAQKAHELVVNRQARLLAAQREELAAQRQADEDAIRRRREQWRAEDEANALVAAERAAERQGRGFYPLAGRAQRPVVY